MDPTTVELIFAGVVAVSTVIYAALTWQLTKETRKLRKVQTEPEFHAILKSYEEMFSLVHLEIKNVGLGPAKNLQFDLQVLTDEPKATEILKEFYETKFLKTGISHFGPGQTIRSGHTNMMEGDLDSRLNASFLLTIEYENIVGEMYTKQFTLDLMELKGSYMLENSSQKLIKELKQINTTLKSIGC